MVPVRILARTDALPPAPYVSAEPTQPRVPVARVSADADPTILGFPADLEDDDEDEDELDSVGHVEVLRHPDRIAAGALVLAGVAANVSLVLPWIPA